MRGQKTSDFTPPRGAGSGIATCKYEEWDAYPKELGPKY